MDEDLMLCRRITRRPAGRLYFEASTGVCHRSARGWESARAHLRRLGYRSGRFRRVEEVSGSWLRQVRVMSLALPLRRLPLIVGRLFRINYREASHRPRAGVGGGVAIPGSGAFLKRGGDYKSPLPVPHVFPGRDEGLGPVAGVGDGVGGLGWRGDVSAARSPLLSCPIVSLGVRGLKTPAPISAGEIC